VNNARASIEKIYVSAPVKLSLLWASLLALHIYNDYLLMFMPGHLEAMGAGSLGPLGEATDLKLLAVAFIIAVPASMIFLSPTVPSSASRGLNMIIGPVYIVIAVFAFFMSPYLFFKFFMAIEFIIILLVIWTATRWSEQDG